MSQFDMSAYVDVAERIREFRAAHPEGSLQPVNAEQPYRIETIADRTFIVYTAAAYRNATDTRPGVGVAWEPFPGRTPYTRDSELMNAETSAWGRAIVAALAADTQRIASADEVRNRQATTQQTAAPAGTWPVSESDAADYVFKFGKHKGKRITEVPGDYLDWLLQQPPKPGFEAQHAQQHALFRRELERRTTTASDPAAVLQAAGERIDESEWADA